MEQKYKSWQHLGLLLKDDAAREADVACGRVAVSSPPLLLSFKHPLCVVGGGVGGGFGVMVE